MRPIINIIVAVTENDAIGKDNKLLFKLKEDMANFKRLTSNQVVIMGRKTYESIGKPLSNRQNIVISRTKHDDSEDLMWATSLEEAIGKFKEEYFLSSCPRIEIFIIGGASLYKEALDKGIVDCVYLTRIKKKVDDADTFFPKLDYFKDWYVYSVDSYKEGNIEYDICCMINRKNHLKHLVE